MWRCPYCGNDNSDNSIFCGKCGKVRDYRQPQPYVENDDSGKVSVSRGALIAIVAIAAASVTLLATLLVTGGLTKKETDAADSTPQVVYVTPSPSPDPMPTPEPTPTPTPAPTPNPFANARVGDVISFGSYEQDNNLSNGAEDIQWLVLEKNSGGILAVSWYGLDCVPFNDVYTYCSWGNCSLRTWLNSSFLYSAFTPAEQAMIQTVAVSADENPQYGNSKKYGTDPGITTNDKVFLLSAVEALSYFPTDTDRRCQPTAYAVARGSKVSSNNGNCWQWLRTPGCYQDQACHVGTVGTVMLEGSRVNAADGCVRPAIWISIS